MKIRIPLKQLISKIRLTIVSKFKLVHSQIAHSLISLVAAHTFLDFSCSLTRTFLLNILHTRDIVTKSKYTNYRKPHAKEKFHSAGSSVDNVYMQQRNIQEFLAQLTNDFTKFILNSVCILCLSTHHLNHVWISQKNFERFRTV